VQPGDLLAALVSARRGKCPGLLKGAKGPSPLGARKTAPGAGRGRGSPGDALARDVLADDLRDAGCDSEDILAHCRDTAATHVRGCWVVDLVLGKE
jgi:hypothetical protein